MLNLKSLLVVCGALALIGCTDVAPYVILPKVPSVTKTVQPVTNLPKVISVTSSLADGRYDLGTQIPVHVVFDKIVKVTDHPQLTISTGTPATTVLNYEAGSGTATLTFLFTVTAGNTSADLDYASSAALTLNGGTIQDTTGGNAILTLPAPGSANSLGGNKNIVMDSAAPEVMKVTVSGISPTGMQTPADRVVTILKLASSEEATLKRVALFYSEPTFSHVTFGDTVNKVDEDSKLEPMNGLVDIQSINEKIATKDEKYLFINARLNIAQSLNYQVLFYEYEDKKGKLHRVGGPEITPIELVKTVDPGFGRRIGSFQITGPQTIEELKVYVKPGSMPANLTIFSNKTKLVSVANLLPGITKINVGKVDILKDETKKFDLMLDVTNGTSAISISIIGTNLGGNVPAVFSLDVPKK